MKAEERLRATVKEIRALDKEAMSKAQARQDRLTKPAGSLGRLEALSVQLAGIMAQPLPEIKEKVVVVMAGDHGVVEESVSAYPAEVTAEMLQNMLRGGAAINVLSEQAGMRIAIVDIGVKRELPEQPGLIAKKIARGTGNIAQGPAMTRDQALEAICAGFEVVEKEKQKGLDLLATGDMGIGNTTASAAVAAAISGHAVEDMVGRGTGLDDEGLSRKVSVVKRALQVNKPEPKDGLEVLARVGGYEIAGLAGSILAAAAHRRPIVIDGVISTAAAMAAVCLAPAVRDYLIAGHRSEERGHSLMLEWLGIEALLDLGMRLGEGSGAVLAVSLVEAACKILAEMATFEETSVSGKSEGEAVV